MRLLAFLSPARLASWAMAGTGFAMASQLLRDRWPSAISALIVMSAAMAWAAAREVRHDDVLGWTMVTGHAVATTAVIVVVMTIGFPGVRDLEWDASSIATVAFACTALLAATSRIPVSTTERTSRRYWTRTTKGVCARSLHAIEHTIVPGQLLWTTYDGTVGALRCNSWWIRYFDYL